jgi:hypothetical protein
VFNLGISFQADLEKEVQTLKKIVDTHQTQLQESEAECADLTHQIEGEKSKFELVYFISCPQFHVDTDLCLLADAEVPVRKGEIYRQAKDRPATGGGRLYQVEERGRTTSRQIEDHELRVQFPGGS